MDVEFSSCLQGSLVYILMTQTNPYPPKPTHNSIFTRNPTVWTEFSPTHKDSSQIKSTPPALNITKRHIHRQLATFRLFTRSTQVWLNITLCKCLHQ